MSETMTQKSIQDDEQPDPPVAPEAPSLLREAYADGVIDEETFEELTEYHLLHASGQTGEPSRSIHDWIDLLIAPTVIGMFAAGMFLMAAGALVGPPLITAGMALLTFGFCGLVVYYIYYNERPE